MAVYRHLPSSGQDRPSLSQPFGTQLGWGLSPCQGKRWPPPLQLSTAIFLSHQAQATVSTTAIGTQLERHPFPHQAKVAISARAVIRCLPLSRGKQLSWLRLSIDFSPQQDRPSQPQLIGTKLEQGPFPHWAKLATSATAVAKSLPPSRGKQPSQLRSCAPSPVGAEVVISAAAVDQHLPPLGQKRPSPPQLIGI